jgi:hypothetical protein
MFGTSDNNGRNVSMIAIALQLARALRNYSDKLETRVDAQMARNES